MASVGAAIVSADMFHDARVVLAGEHTFGGDMPSTGELMAEELLLAGVESERIVVLDNSFGFHFNNTSFQVKALGLWLEELKIQPRLLTLAYDFHMVRLKRCMRSSGIKSDFADIVTTLNSVNLGSEYPEHDFLSSFNARERLVRAFSLFDRKGILTRLITGINGPHVHDVCQDEDGEFQFMNMSATSRLAEVNTRLTKT